MRHLLPILLIALLSVQASLPFSIAGTGQSVAVTSNQAHNMVSGPSFATNRNHTTSSHTASAHMSEDCCKDPGCDGTAQQTSCDMHGCCLFLIETSPLSLTNARNTMVPSIIEPMIALPLTPPHEPPIV